MRYILLSLFCFFDFLSAEPGGKLPKIDGAFLSGKQIARTNEEGFVGYRYLFDSGATFDQIKKDLEKCLGLKWIEKRRKEKEYLALKQVMKRDGILVEGIATYENPEGPKWKITLLMKKETDRRNSRYIVEVVCSPK